MLYLACTWRFYLTKTLDNSNVGQLQLAYSVLRTGLQDYKSPSHHVLNDLQFLTRSPKLPVIMVVPINIPKKTHVFGLVEVLGACRGGHKMSVTGRKQIRTYKGYFEMDYEG